MISPLTYATHSVCSSCVLFMSVLSQLHTRCVSIDLSTFVDANSSSDRYCSASEEERSVSSTTSDRWCRERGDEERKEGKREDSEMQKRRKKSLRMMRRVRERAMADLMQTERERRRRERTVLR